MHLCGKIHINGLEKFITKILFQVHRRVLTELSKI